MELNPKYIKADLKLIQYGQHLCSGYCSIAHLCNLKFAEQNLKNPKVLTSPKVIEKFQSFSYPQHIYSRMLFLGKDLEGK